MCVASLRSTGAVPWAIAIAWIAFAALQEPLLLRAYGICLPVQAAAVTAVVLSILVSMALPRTQSCLAHLVSTAIVAIVIPAALGLAVWALDRAVGRASLPSPPYEALASISIIILSVCVYARFSVSMGGWAVAFLPGYAVLASQLVRLRGPEWPHEQTAASILALFAATTVALVYCRKKT